MHAVNALAFNAAAKNRELNVRENVGFWRRRLRNICAFDPDDFGQTLEEPKIHKAPIV